jgi:GDP-4-dehydro-6-deoxy-D-mannose reductase
LSLSKPEPTGPSLDFRAVLITGGAGFVGRKIVRRLRAALPAMSRVVVVGRSNVIVPDCDFLAFDLEHGASVDGVVAAARPDLIVHLAAQSFAAGAAGATWGTNLAGSLNLARATGKYVPDALTLYVSSSEVYGLAFNDGPVTEETVCKPQSAYSRSKLAAEEMFADVLPPSARLVVCRPSNHSGAGQEAKFALPSFAGQIVSGQSEIHVGNLGAQRDFLHVDDVVDAYHDVLANVAALGPRSTFNVCSGQPRAVGDLLDRMIELAGSRASVVIDPDRFRSADIPVTEMSSDLLRGLTGWAPKRSIDQMLSDVLEHARAQAERV